MDLISFSFLGAMNLGEKTVLTTQSHLLILRVDAFMIYLGEANILAKNRWILSVK